MPRFRMTFIGLTLVEFLAGTVVVEADNKSRDMSDYLNTVRAYADAMIEQGQDAYGQAHSPLFAEEMRLSHTF